MIAPKSIFLINRKNLEWLNEKMIPYMREEFSTKFTILCGENKVSMVKEWCNKNDCVLNLSELINKADEFSVAELEKIYEKARTYEEKYNITYLRDSILQDRRYALNYIHTAVYNPMRESKGDDYIKIINKQNFYFDYVEKLFGEREVDMVIARPDNLIGFAVTTVAMARDIPVTINDVTKLDGYMYWTYGPYCKDTQLKNFVDNISQEDLKKLDTVKIETSSHSFKDRDNLIKALAFNALISNLIYILKDRLNWILKDIKRRKLGKRVSMIKVIYLKIKAYREHRYFQKLFESDLNTIKKLPYVYFPLPTEPEFNTHSLSKEFINTYAMIQQVAISLPSGFNLVIKEHTPNIGSRSIDFYLRLKKIPNVIIANYIISGPELINYANSIVTVAGSSAIEAAERGKNAVIFATSVEYQFLPNIIKGHSMRNLPKVFKTTTKEISEERKKEIIRSAKLLKLAYKKCGYYAPNTSLFHGNSKNIDIKELQKAVIELINIYNMQNLEYMNK